MSSVLLEKLIVTQLVKKFPAFYGSRKFITVFTRARKKKKKIYICIYKVKGKFVPEHHAMKTYWEWRYSATHFRPRHQKDVSGQLYTQTHKVIFMRFY
jgi:hypothetical protein